MGNSPFPITSGTLSYPYVTVGTQGTGIVNQSGGTLTVGNTFTVGSTTSSNGTYNLSGGSVSIANSPKQIIGYSGVGNFSQSGGSVTTNGGTLYLAYSAGAGTYSLSSGTLNTGAIQVGYGSGAALFTQSGGTYTTGTLALTSTNTTSQGTYNLAGGTLTAGTIKGSNGTSTFNFNGGTLQPSASTFTLTGLTTANVQSGGAFIDTSTYGVTIGQALGHDITAGAPAIDGGLTLAGTTGALTLSAANNYTGPTTINGGTLSVSGSLAGTSAITVNNGGTLLLSGTASTDHLNNAASLSIASGGKFSTGGASEGTATAGSTAGIGALTLNGGSSFDFASTGSTVLAASGVVSGPGKISILDWSGTVMADSGSASNDRLLFVNNPNFTAAQLAQIEFYNAAGTDLGSAGEISYDGFTELVPVPVPEPVTWLGGTLLVGAAAWQRGRLAGRCPRGRSDYSGFQHDRAEAFRL